MMYSVHELTIQQNHPPQTAQNKLQKFHNENFSHRYLILCLQPSEHFMHLNLYNKLKKKAIFQHEKFKNVCKYIVPALCHDMGKEHFIVYLICITLKTES